VWHNRSQWCAPHPSIRPHTVPQPTRSCEHRQGGHATSSSWHECDVRGWPRVAAGGRGSCAWVRALNARTTGDRRLEDSETAWADQLFVDTGRTGRSHRCCPHPSIFPHTKSHSSSRCSSSSTPPCREEPLFPGIWLRWSNASIDTCVLISPYLQYLRIHISHLVLTNLWKVVYYFIWTYNPCSICGAATSADVTYSLGSETIKKWVGKVYRNLLRHLGQILSWSGRSGRQDR